MPKFENDFVDMTKEEAEYAKSLRERGCTWRAVAMHCDEKWNGNWGSNQLAGMYILERAEKVLGAPKNSILQSA